MQDREVLLLPIEYNSIIDGMDQYFDLVTNTQGSNELIELDTNE